MLWLLRWVQRFLGITPKYRVCKQEELPTALDHHTLYLLGDGECYWMAAIKCPCGCGDLIQLSLASSGHPRWTVDMNQPHEVSLHPSVHRMTGCRSHFFLKKGKVVWCKP